jgi:photosystem II stability/assembly factor-like uncharacterized protein
MKKFTSFVFGSALTILLLAPLSIRAQWTNVAPNLAGPENQRIGAISFGGGVVWAGASEALFFSLDTGKTWTQSTIPESSGISDISVFDSVNVLVATQEDGVFLTTDGGNTWTIVVPGGTLYDRVSFNGSASVMHALENTPSVLWTSTDGGNTWSQQNFGDEGLSFAIGADKTVYVFSSSQAGWINYSTDSGQTWSGNGTGTYSDSQGLAADSCDVKKLYLVNENTRDRTGGTTKIDVTPDAGQTWQTNSSHQLDYYNGSIANTSQAVFVTTDAGGNGVLRSTDEGASWQSIGGPMTYFDTRSIALANNNIVFVLDSNGSVWLTTNSGGDSLTFPKTAPGGTALVLSNTTMQVNGNVCGPLDTGVVFYVQSCIPNAGVLDSFWITGSAAFTQVCPCIGTPFQLVGSDSIPFRYWGAGTGNDTAELHLAFSLGGVTMDTTIRLLGSSTSSKLTPPALLNRENAVAYVGQLDSLALGVNINSQINLDSLWPSLTDLWATYTWDSSIVRYISYLPPSGWDITSLIPRGDSVDIAIHNVSSTAQTPLDLGTALFTPNQDEPATSWVQLPDLTLVAGGQNIPICVGDDEDNHWAVKTLGMESGVAEVPSSTQNLSIYPNPADGNAWIYSSEDLGAVTIEVYDMLGVRQSVVSSQINENNPVELLLPARSGVYMIMVRSISGTQTLRVVQQQ